MRQEKIKLLTRINRGKLSAPSYLAALTEALGEAVPQSALVSLAETDRITESFRQGYRAASSDQAVTYRRFFAAGQVEHVFQIAERLANQLPTEVGYLFIKRSEDCGAIRLRLAALLLHAAAVIRLDGDSLSVLSLGHQQGLLIDHNADDEDRRYEITIWGDQWSIVAMSCETA